MSIKLVKPSHFLLKSYVGSTSMNAVFHLEGSFRSIKLVKPSHVLLKSHVESTSMNAVFH